MQQEKPRLESHLVLAPQSHLTHPHQGQALFSTSSLTRSATKILELCLLDLKIKSYLLCILFVVLEALQHSLTGVPNDFLNTFLSLLQLNKAGAVISPPQGGKKKTPLNQNGGTWLGIMVSQCRSLLLKPAYPQALCSMGTSVRWKVIPFSAQAV